MEHHNPSTALYSKKVVTAFFVLPAGGREGTEDLTNSRERTTGHRGNTTKREQTSQSAFQSGMLSHCSERKPVQRGQGESHSHTLLSVYFQCPAPLTTETQDAKHSCSSEELVSFKPAYPVPDICSSPKSSLSGPSPISSLPPLVFQQQLALLI